MIKSYILIQTYPDSPELGTISSENTLLTDISNQLHKFTLKGKIISQETIELNPDFWVELRFSCGDILDNILNPPQTTRVTLNNIVHVNSKADRYKLQNDLPSNFKEYEDELLYENNHQLSFKYQDKLNILDTLLNLRDEYNNNETKFNPIFCIKYDQNENCFEGFTYYMINSLFSFKTRKLRDLFLKNFKTQLEQIKDLI